MDLKEKIAANFTISAARYDQYAVMQQQVARAFVRKLADFCHQLPEGPILEVGCGTGAVSCELVTSFPGRELTLIDLSPGMVAKNRQALIPLLLAGQRVDWQVMDAETVDIQNHCALIVSCLTLQWFQDVTGSLSRLCAALAPGGFLFCSYLGKQSFPEWQAICRTLDVPCTMNRLPDSQMLLDTLHSRGYSASSWSETVEQSYSTSLDFFRSLKKTGTSTHSAGHRLTVSQMAKLLSSWPKDHDGRVTITYQVNSILVKA
ncbi:MAG: methyltransferase domain-containing protein [Desulfobulbaceae bacterium]|nr:methyltransferase domain-containing protein [Desulfobulbaceae bacterium]